jgi:hypothetical protein
MGKSQGRAGGLMFAGPSKGPDRKQKTKSFQLSWLKTNFKSLPTSLFKREEKLPPLEKGN